MSTHFLVALETEHDSDGADCLFAFGIWDGAPVWTGRQLLGWGREDVEALFGRLKAEKAAEIANIQPLEADTELWTDMPRDCSVTVQRWMIEHMFDHFEDGEQTQFGYLLGLDGTWRYTAKSYQAGFVGAKGAWAPLTEKVCGIK